MPALVQQCAEALLAVLLPAGPTLEVALAAAAELAFPRDAAAIHASRHPACPWLLQQLLRLHRDGRVLSPERGVWAAASALLKCAEPGRHSSSTLGSTLATWLSLPAAGSIAPDRLASMFSKVCEHGLADALPALLRMPAVQALLREEAAQPLALSANRAAQLVCSAAGLGRAEVLDAVLAAGGAVTLNAVRSAATQLGAAASPRALRALQLLLRRGRPLVPLDGRALGALLGVGYHDTKFTACPIFAVLACCAASMDQVRGGVRLHGLRTPLSRAGQRSIAARAGGAPAAALPAASSPTLTCVPRPPFLGAVACSRCAQMRGTTGTTTSRPPRSPSTSCTSAHWRRWTAWRMRVRGVAARPAGLSGRGGRSRICEECVRQQPAVRPPWSFHSAGYRPCVFTHYCKTVFDPTLATYNPADDPRLAQHWELNTSGRCARMHGRGWPPCRRCPPAADVLALDGCRLGASQSWAWP